MTTEFPIEGEKNTSQVSASIGHEWVFNPQKSRNDQRYQQEVKGARAKGAAPKLGQTLRPFKCSVKAWAQRKTTHSVSCLPEVHPMWPNIHAHDQWHNSSHFRGEETKGPSRSSGLCQEPRNINRLPTCAQAHIHPVEDAPVRLKA